MVERIAWDDDAADHLRTRSTRYSGATDIDPAWTVDVVNDPERVVDEPDPRSRHANSVRVVGYSPAARIVVHRRGAEGRERRAARRVSVEDDRRRPAPVPGGGSR